MPAPCTAWTFAVPVSTLFHAATTKVTYHTERAAHYRTTRDETLARLRAEGVSIDDGAESTAFSTYRQPSVKIDPQLETQLGEAKQKVFDHERALREFQRYRWALDLQLRSDAGAVRYCTIEDIEVFGLLHSQH